MSSDYLSHPEVGTILRLGLRTPNPSGQKSEKILKRGSQDLFALVRVARLQNEVGPKYLF